MGGLGPGDTQRGETGPVQSHTSLPSPRLGCAKYIGLVQNCEGGKRKEKKDDKSWDISLKMFKLWEIWGKLYEIITSKNSIENFFFWGI